MKGAPGDSDRSPDLCRLHLAARNELPEFRPTEPAVLLRLRIGEPGYLLSNDPHVRLRSRVVAMRCIMWVINSHRGVINANNEPVGVSGSGRTGFRVRA